MKIQRKKVFRNQACGLVLAEMIFNILYSALEDMFSKCIDQNTDLQVVFRVYYVIWEFNKARMFWTTMKLMINDIIFLLEYLMKIFVKKRARLK